MKNCAMIFLLLLTGCISRETVTAEVWLNSGLPKAVCDANPELREFGMYRKLNSGKYEVQPYCNSQAKKYVSMHGKRFNELLDKYLPKENSATDWQNEINLITGDQ